jgi:hypothetical protein
VLAAMQMLHVLAYRSRLPAPLIPASMIDAAMVNGPWKRLVPGVCDQCEAERLVDLVVEVVATNAALTSRASTCARCSRRGPALPAAVSRTAPALIGAKPTWDGGP